jgi:hypothetical protein
MNYVMSDYHSAMVVYIELVDLFIDMILQKLFKMFPV